MDDLSVLQNCVAESVSVSTLTLSVNAVLIKRFRTLSGDICILYLLILILVNNTHFQAHAVVLCIKILGKSVLGRNNKS